jgi:hypothetical protein
VNEAVAFLVLASSSVTRADGFSSSIRVSSVEALG